MIVFETEFYPEICCDVCNEIIHNHFDCPICKTHYAGTSIYLDFNYLDKNHEFYCEKCNSKFILRERGIEFGTYKIEYIGKGE